MPSLVSVAGFEDFYRGDSMAYTLQFTDITFDITGYQFFTTFKVSKNDADTSAILIKRFTPPANANSTSGLLYLPYESDDTNRFEPGSYFYDIQMVTNDFPPKIFTLFEGKVRVLTDISRLES